MKRPVTPSIPWRIILVCLALVLCSACATIPPYEATDLGSIAGRWRGYAYASEWGSFFMTFTIVESGEFKVRSDRPFELLMAHSGNVWIADGKFLFTSNTKGLNGTGTLYRSEKGRWISFRSNNGSMTVELRPL